MRKEQQDALARAEGLEATPKNLERVSKLVGAELARWAFVQWSLRDRAKTKFKRASEMLFTRDGLEMASHETVAQLHASLFTSPSVVDLTTGIGSDLIALAGLRRAVGLDLDPEHVRYARHNLRVHGRTGKCFMKDCTTIAPIRKDRGYFVDPQRRTQGKRTLDPEQFSPNITTILQVLGNSNEVAMKLSPMLSDSFLNSLGGRVWFVSHQRQCCEALVLLGGLERLGIGGAIHAETRTFLPIADQQEILDEPLTYVHEADPAAIRAHCLGSFTAPGLGDSNGYLTSDEPSDSLWLRSYRILWSGPWRVDKAKQALANLGVQVTAVKTRGVEIDVTKVAKELGNHSGPPCVVMLYQSQRAIRAAISEPV